VKSRASPTVTCGGVIDRTHEAPGDESNQYSQSDVARRLCPGPWLRVPCARRSNRHESLSEAAKMTEVTATEANRDALTPSVMSPGTNGRVEEVGFLRMWREWVVVIFRCDDQTNSQTQKAVTNRLRF
jgi:hypothetical protein